MFDLIIAFTLGASSACLCVAAYLKVDNANGDVELRNVNNAVDQTAQLAIIVAQEEELHM